MAGKVFSFRGAMPEGSGVVADEIVEMLTDYLEQAKRGEVVGIALAGVRPSGRTFTGWLGSARGYRNELMSASTVLQHRMALAINEDS